MDRHAGMRDLGYKVLGAAFAVHNALAIMAEQQLEKDHFEDGALYRFCNKERRILKALYWDATGFCLRHKRLGQHCVPSPQTAERGRETSREQLSMLLRTRSRSSSTSNRKSWEFLRSKRLRYGHAAERTRVESRSRNISLVKKLF